MTALVSIKTQPIEGGDPIIFEWARLEDDRTYSIYYHSKLKCWVINPVWSPAGDKSQQKVYNG